MRRKVRAAAFLASVGCASSPASGPEGGTIRAPGIAIEVENGGNSSFRVFAVVRGEETLIGRAQPLQTTRLRLPAGRSGQLSLLIRPSAGRGGALQHRSEPFTVVPGQRVEWRLRPSVGHYMPQLSSVSIFACGDTEPC